MASIVKRKKKYSVVYSYTDENGKEHKKWETFESNAEAKHRKAEIEFAKANGTLKGPSAKTVRELLEDYMSIYGVNTWAMSMVKSVAFFTAGSPSRRSFFTASRKREQYSFQKKE